MRFTNADINRSCFRPPTKLPYPNLSRGEIHWDIDPRNGSEGWIQAIVLLTNISQNTGGFQCIPEIYQLIDSWLIDNAHGANFDHFNPGLDDDPRIQQLSGKTGDLIIWSTLSPHGPAVNLSNMPGIATFMTLTPNKRFGCLKNEMKYLIETRRAPSHWRGLPGQLDPEPGEPVYSSPLGERLVGFRAWQ